MKILAEPDNQKNPRHICKKCNAVFEFDIDDVQEKDSFISSGKRKFVECPCCGESVNMFYLGTNGKAWDDLKKKLYG